MTTLGNVFESNQFQQSNCRGREDLQLNLNKFPVMLKNDDEEQITSAGDMVKLVAGAAGVPTVAEVLTTDNYSATVKYGFIPLGRLQNQYKTGDLTVACFSGCIITMLAGEAINSGAYVAYDNGYIINNPSTSTAGKIPCGFALDTAKAKDDLIRVLIL